MADLSDIQASQAVKIAGANPSTGVEDNFAEVDSNGQLKAILPSNGSVTPGTVATNSNLIGGQYNSTLPILTTGQQAAVQVDASGRLLVISDIVDNTNPTQNITVQDTATTSTSIANGQSVFTGTPTAGSTATFTLSSDETVVVEATGTWTGTLQIEVSMDNGTTWFIRTIHQAGGSSSGTAGSFTANFAGGCNVGGWTNFRVRSVATMTGTAIIKVIQSLNPNSIFIANPIRISDASNNLATITSTGLLNVQASIVDGTKATYSTSAVGFIPAAATTDVFIFKGSGTKTIKITRIEVSITTTAGSGGLVTCSLIKRSSANTGGTTVSDTAVPHDSLDAAATGTVVHYTANPTALGTAVGTIRSVRLEANNTSTSPTYSTWDFGIRTAKAIVLRGTSEFIAINFGGATVTGPIASINVEWTEE